MDPQLEEKKNLMDSHMRAALQKDKGTNTQLLSWTVEDFIKKGDHFTGVVTSAKVEYKTFGKEDAETYVIKVTPVQPMKALRDMVTQGCRKELLFYQELAPALNAELRAIGLEPLHIPKCLYVSSNPEEPLLIMADLRQLEFRRFPEGKCLDVPHTNLILQELARLHASSYLLENKIGCKNFDGKYNFLEKEWYNVTDNATAFFKTLFDGNIENAVALLRMLKGDERAIKWLRKIKPDVYDILEEQMRRNTVFTTLCHADCISTNTLFRYNDEGIPVEVVLLDFQQVRKASLVTDINLLLYICLYGTDRRKNVEDFLQSYFSSFKNVLDASGLQMPFSFQELFHEYESKILFGSLWAMSVIPMVTGVAEAEEWNNNKKDDDEEEEEAGEETKEEVKEKGKDATEGQKVEERGGGVSESEEEAEEKGMEEEQKKVDVGVDGKDCDFRRRFMPIFEELIERGIIR